MPLARVRPEERLGARRGLGVAGLLGGPQVGQVRRRRAPRAPPSKSGASLSAARSFWCQVASSRAAARSSARASSSSAHPCALLGGGRERVEAPEHRLRLGPEGPGARAQALDLRRQRARLLDEGARPLATAGAVEEAADLRGEHLGARVTRRWRAGHRPLADRDEIPRDLVGAPDGELLGRPLDHLRQDGQRRPPERGSPQRSSYRTAPREYTSLGGPSCSASPRACSGGM